MNKIALFLGQPYVNSKNEYECVKMGASLNSAMCNDQLYPLCEKLAFRRPLITTTYSAFITRFHHG